MSAPAAAWPGRVGAGFVATLRALGRFALDALLPPQCLTCDQPVGEPGQFCASCFRLTSFVTPPACERCALPVLHAGQLGQDAQGWAACARCLAMPPPWTRARAALRYDEQARRLLLPFKHADRVEFARPLVRMMARAAPGLMRNADLLVPVPLHRSRLLARRYNQSALLARGLGNLSGRPVALTALARVRRTPSLGHLSRAERAEAVADAFVVRRRCLARLVGARVLLIDDVLTSGATAAACAAALRSAGCAQVDLLVAARVPESPP